MINKQKYLSMHPNKIYQSKDGRWFTKVPVVEKGQIVRKKDKAFHSKTEAEDYVAEIYRSLEEDPLLIDIFTIVQNDHLDNDEIAPSTYMRNWGDFKRFFDEFGYRNIRTVTEFDVEDFIIEQKRKYKLTAKGFAALATCLRSIFRYARRKKYVSYSIDDIIKYMDLGRNGFRKVEKDEYEEVFTDEEVKKLVQTLRGDLSSTHLGLMLLFGTGLRIGELAVLRWEDYNGISIHVHGTETRHWDKEGHNVFKVKNRPKTLAGQRHVPVPTSMEWIMDKLKEFNPDGEFIFMTYSREKGEMVRTRADYFRKSLKLACKHAGIPAKSPHKIRKTYASILLDHEVSKKTIIENMGHTDIKVTRSHYGRQRKSEQQRLAVVDEIEEFQMLAQ